MNEMRLKDIEQRLAATTGLAWVRDRPIINGKQVFTGLLYAYDSPPRIDPVASGLSDADAIFIIRARVDIPELILAVRILREITLDALALAEETADKRVAGLTLKALRARLERLTDTDH